MPDASILKAFATLVSVVAGLAVLLMIIKKYAKKGKKIVNQLDLQVISKISLQPKSHLYLIKAGDNTLLIGVTDNNINTLADLTENKEHPVNSVQKSLKTRINPSPDTNNTKELETALSFGSFIKSAFRKNVN